jgi:hypothetical protein
MGYYLDVVINCGLRPDIPQEYIDALRYLTSPEGTVQLPIKPETVIESEFGTDLWDYFTQDGPLLSPDPENGTITNFYSMTSFYRENVVLQYHLQFTAHHVHDDTWANGLAEFFYWLPTIAVDGFIGYHKGTESNEVHLLYAKAGRCVDQNGNPLFSGTISPLPPDV